MLDEAGFPDAIISASNDLDEYLIDSLKMQGAAINSWGVGTNLITAKDCPSFGGVYKLAAVKDKTTGEFIPKIKLSENAEKLPTPATRRSSGFTKKKPERLSLISSAWWMRNSTLTIRSFSLIPLRHGKNTPRSQNLYHA